MQTEQKVLTAATDMNRQLVQQLTVHFITDLGQANTLEKIEVATNVYASVIIEAVVAHDANQDSARKHLAETVRSITRMLDNEAGALDKLRAKMQQVEVQAKSVEVSNPLLMGKLPEVAS